MKLLSSRRSSATAGRYCMFRTEGTASVDFPRESWIPENDRAHERLPCSRDTVVSGPEEKTLPGYSPRSHSEIAQKTFGGNRVNSFAPCTLSSIRGGEPSVQNVNSNGVRCNPGRAFYERPENGRKSQPPFSRRVQRDLPSNTVLLRRRRPLCLDQALADAVRSHPCTLARAHARSLGDESREVNTRRSILIHSGQVVF